MLLVGDLVVLPPAPLKPDGAKASPSMDVRGRIRSEHIKLNKDTLLQDAALRSSYMYIGNCSASVPLFSVAGSVNHMWFCRLGLQVSKHRPCYLISFVPGRGVDWAVWVLASLLADGLTDIWMQVNTYLHTYIYTYMYICIDICIYCRGICNCIRCVLNI